MIFSNPTNMIALKRGRTEVSFPKEPPMNCAKPDNYPRFLIIEFIEKENPITSPPLFLISACLENIVGKLYKAKKQRPGELFVEVKNQQQAKILLTQTCMADLDIRVAPNRSINSSQGVISDTDLVNDTEADLPEGLKDQGVTALRHITIRRDNKEIDTKDIILTFDRSPLPEHMNVGFIP